MSQILNFTDDLLNHIEQRLVNPLSILAHLRSRGRCAPQCRCQQLANLLNHSHPWSRVNQTRIFEQMWSWYCKRYEEPFNAAFLLPAIAEFLQIQKYTPEQICHGFRMEFNAGGARAENIPQCFYRDQRSVKINKPFGGQNGMCCDFALVNFFKEHLVGEVKLLMPNTPKNYLKKFRDDLNKGLAWLDSTCDDLRDPFGIQKFNAAVCILIDLTDGRNSRSWWASNVNEGYYRRRGVIARHIVLG